MSLKIKNVLLLLLLLVLVACGEENSTVLPTVAPTLTIEPATVAVALVPTTHSTPTLSPTPIIVNTPTPTLTPTKIVAPTPTPEPPSTPTPAATPVLPTFTPILPTVTATRIPPTAIRVPSTFTPVLSTATPVPPAVPPTAATLTSPIGTPDAEEQAFLVQFNEFRQSRGQKPLIFDPLLYQSAKWMAEDMATKNYISHTDSLGRSVTDRIRSFGYKGGWVGENIAGGFEHATDNLNIWQSDDIHINNMLGQSYTKVGVARYYFKNSLNGWHWVLDMGTN